MTHSTCYCGGLPAGSTLEQCCGPALNGERWPETAEALMRSRYSAFVTQNEDHLFRTWHPRFRPADLGVDSYTRWLGLQILSVEGGADSDSEGYVEFQARYSVAGTEEVLTERSRFSRRAGRWMYEEGTA